MPLPLLAAVAPAAKAAAGGFLKSAAFKKSVSLLGGGGGGEGGGQTKTDGSGLLKKMMGKSGISSADAAAGVYGIGKTIAGKIKGKKADEMLPMGEDPEERKLQREYARKKRSLASGTAMESERNSLKEMAKQGMTNSFRAGGGTKGLAMMSRMFNEGVAGLNTNAAAQEAQYAQMEQAQVTKLADRKLQLGLLKYNTKKAEAAQTLKEGKTAVGGSLSRILGVGTPYEFGAAAPEKETAETT